MKVTSFKDVETYLYTSVIMPLKGLNAPEFEFGSPIQGDNGVYWTLLLERSPLERRYRRNYQNERAERNRNWEIQLHTGENKNHVLATYDINNHNIYLYKQPFRILDAIPLMGKMHDMFSRTQPFNNIMIEDAVPVPKPRRQRGETFRDAEEAPGFDPDWGEEENDDL